ncbi:MAG: DUF3261 domain-containing protein [Pelobacteraceae bacterium]
MVRFVTLLIGILLAAGCTHIPFQEAEQVSFEAADPKSVVEQFKAHSPESFQLLNSVVFEYSWKTFMGIGYIDVNRQNSQFKVVCLNPMGVQLFELSGDRDAIVTHNALPALTQYGDLPTAVGTDIRRIYFDLVPSDKARIWKSAYRIKFRQSYGSGVMEYEFAGKGQELVEKVYYENDEIVWRICYYEYREQNGKHYPQGIVMINYRHGYQLTVRQKELYS